MNLAAVTLRRRRPPGLLASSGGLIACLAAAAAIASAIAAKPAALRPFLAGLLLAALIVVSLRWPRLAVLLTMAFLPVLALLRRLLIPVAGFATFDPLLLVAPAFAAFVVVRLFVVERRPLPHDARSKLVLLVMAIAVLQVVNPLGQGLLVGVSGLLFVAGPMLWFFVGREVADRALVANTLTSAVLLAIPLGLYCLWQTEIALPPWDAEWVEVNGYSALFVNDTLRAFGTFSSSQEYAVYTAAAAAFAVALATAGRSWALLALPVPLVAVALSAVRSALVLVVLAVVLMLGLRTRRTVTALAVIVLGLAAAVFGVRALESALGSGGASPANPFLEHQVSGISDPFDADQSTLALHVELVREGILEGIRQPLGYGTGSTSLANTKFTGGAPPSAEVDMANAFIEWGILGGLAYLTLVVSSLAGAIRLQTRRGDGLTLAVVGLLVVALGSWIGGLYAVSPLVWLLLGWTARELTVRSPDRSRPHPARLRTPTSRREAPPATPAAHRSA